MASAVRSVCARLVVERRARVAAFVHGSVDRGGHRRVAAYEQRQDRSQASARAERVVAVGWCGWIGRDRATDACGGACARGVLGDAWWRCIGASSTESMSVESSFFELGGNSLRAVSLARRLSSSLGRSVSVADVMRTPTASSLASSADDGDGDVVGASSVCVCRRCRVCWTRRVWYRRRTLCRGTSRSC